jgi:hypothetical protein
MMLRVLELRNYDSVGVRIFCWEEMLREQNSFVSDCEGRRNLFTPPGDRNFGNGMPNTNVVIICVFSMKIPCNFLYISEFRWKIMTA